MRFTVPSQTATRALWSSIDRYCKFKQTPITIDHLTQFGRTPDASKALMSCKWLHNELPIRLAHMTKEINALPQDLLAQRGVRLVSDGYLQSFRDLVDYSGADSTSDKDYVRTVTSLVRNIHQRHANVVQTMAQGIVELKAVRGTAIWEDQSIPTFLDRFYLSRIGIRMLISQHLELFASDNQSTPTDSWVGIIDESTCVNDVCHDAIRDATFLCEANYMTAPRVRVRSYDSHGATDSICFSYVPSHLHHILFELLKNSFRATVEHCGSDGDLPPVDVVIVKGDNDLSIKISDEGGGIPRADVDKIFSYSYTTAGVPVEDCSESTPMAGLGYGLPLSRLYAKYFGGDLSISSMEGFGTDALIHLNVAANDNLEVLPMFGAEAAELYRQDPSPPSPESDIPGPFARGSMLV